jgi:hypothetical protein
VSGFSFGFLAFGFRALSRLPVRVFFPLRPFAFSSSLFGLLGFSFLGFRGRRLARVFFGPVVVPRRSSFLVPRAGQAAGSGRVHLSLRRRVGRRAGRVQLATKRDETRRVVRRERCCAEPKWTGRRRVAPCSWRAPRTFLFFCGGRFDFPFFVGVGAGARFLDVWVGLDWRRADGRR